MQRRMVSGDNILWYDTEKTEMDIQLSKEDEATTEEVEVCFRTSVRKDHVG
jgi:hypothetical protein